MRKIQELYRLNGSVLEKLDMQTIHPADIFYQCQELNDKYMVVVKDTEQKSDTFVELSLLFTVTSLIADSLAKLATCDENWHPGDALPDPINLTWEVIGECITDKMVMGYNSSIPDFGDASRAIKSLQVLHTTDFECSYCLLDTPEDRNVKFRRWALKDIAITKLNKKHPIQLENCILSVNGCLSRPIMFKEELLMARGAEFIHNNSMEKLPSVTLLDFTNLGGIEIVPFHECRYKPRTSRKGVGAWGAAFFVGEEVEIELPKRIDLSNKHVWMVLGHSLHFEDRLAVSGNRTVIIAPHFLSLDTCLLKAEYHAFRYYRETDVFHTEDTLNDYLNITAWSPDHYGAFFIVINTPNMYIRATRAQQYAKERMSVTTPETDGFVWDNRTRSIFDNTRAWYKTYNDYYIMPPDHYSYLTTYDWSGIHEGVENVRDWYKPYLSNVDATDLQVMEIIRA